MRSGLRKNELTSECGVEKAERGRGGLIGEKTGWMGSFSGLFKYLMMRR